MQIISLKVVSKIPVSSSKSPRLQKEGFPETKPPLGPSAGAPPYAGTHWEPGALLNLPAGSLCRVCCEHPADTTALLVAHRAGPFHRSEVEFKRLASACEQPSFVARPSCEVRAQFGPCTRHLPDSRDPGAVGALP